MLIKFEKGIDVRSNLMQTKFASSDPIAGHTQLFKGYESQNIETFTPENIQEFFLTPQEEFQYQKFKKESFR